MIPFGPLVTAAVVITNANVVTVDARAPHARCVLVEGERIARVGAKDGDCAARGATVLDAGGATLVPGFNDAHVHFGLSLTLAHAPKIPALPRPRWLDAVRAAAARTPFGSWLVAESNELPDGVARSRDLDFIDHPILVITRHGALFNSRGKVRAGLDGQVAQGFVSGRHVAAALETVTWAQRPQAVLWGARELLGRARAAGLTSLQLISDEMPDLFEHLRRAGELTARVRFVPLGYRFDTMLYEPRWPARAPLWVRVDGIKYFHDDPAQLSRRELAEIVTFARTHRIRVVMHVLGRYSLRKYLDAVETGTASDPGSARLFRIDHADELRPDEARRIAKLGMVVCANPPLIAEWKSDRLGPLQTLREAGVPLCLGTDWYGDGSRPLEPLAGLALAATHGGHGQAERISAAQALEAYTLGSALAEGLEREKGSIEPGKLADLVLLSADPTRVPPEEIPRLQVLFTMVGGRLVYRAPAPLPPRGRAP